MNITISPTTEDEAQAESAINKSDVIELPGTDTYTQDLIEPAEEQATAFRESVLIRRIRTKQTCPTCGSSNLSVAAYCDECGAMLTEHEAALRSLPPLPVGSLINERYRVEELLTQGDCNVYLASSKDDTFIVKEGAGDQNTFETEIAKLKRTAYPTVTTFVERVEQENQYYFICTAPRSMAPLYVIHFASWREVVRAILSLCQTLQKLHDVHILLNDFSAVQWNADEGRVFVYELAHSMETLIPEQRDEADNAEAVWADANFAAPEVQRNWLTEIGVSSDLYALAALCYQLLFGKPYAPPTLDDTSPSNEGSAIVSFPPTLYRVLLTCLHPDPTHRLDSVEAFKSEVISLLAVQHHRWGAGSDVGQLRAQNQDAYFAQSAVVYTQSEQNPAGLYLVADGMGGGKAGDLASRIVVETCQKSWGEMLCDTDFYRKTDSEWLSWVCDVLTKANAAIINAAGGDEMGSTATLCLVVNQRAYVAHIGDSRAYLIDGEEIEQLTDDHSLVAHLVRMGELTPEEAANHPQRHIIYKTLGIERELEPDCLMRLLSTDHALLICSDGLHGMVNDDQLLRGVSDENLEHTEKISALINLANEAGGLDNITAVYVTFH